MKTILVTGGAGFIGSHLCERLLSLGHRIICADNLYTGAIDNIKHLRSHARFAFLHHDICAPLELEVDEIYNLACPASPKQYQRDPIFTLRTNVVGADNLLALATRCNARILQASTSEVYGDAERHPQAEGYWGNVNPVGPRSCYDEGKRAAETLFYDYRHFRGTNTAIARIFNTYGPRMANDDGRVVSNMVVQALMGEDLTIYGEGLQTRSFCYVDDLVEGLIALMAAGPGQFGPINLGNPAEIAIRDLADRIVRMTGNRSGLAYRPLPVDDPRQRRPDITLACSQLSWQPKWALDKGLEMTIAYFSGKLAARAEEFRL